ncbi:hypothetical protein WQ54_06765 [Bacillus sp. SA1-12]|nr:hypothetical protein WQ54_06765 [Bacillus sp. SA1-12]
MSEKPVISILSLVLSPFSLLLLGLIIPWEPLMDLHTFFGEFSFYSALIGTILGIWELTKKERKSIALLGFLLNGIPLGLFILMMIMMFLSFVVGI